MKCISADGHSWHSQNNVSKDLNSIVEDVSNVSFDIYLQNSYLELRGHDLSLGRCSPLTAEYIHLPAYLRKEL